MPLFLYAFPVTLIGGFLLIPASWLLESNFAEFGAFGYFQFDTGLVCTSCYDRWSVGTYRSQLLLKVRLSIAYFDQRHPRTRTWFPDRMDVLLNRDSWSMDMDWRADSHGGIISIVYGEHLASTSKNR